MLGWIWVLEGVVVRECGTDGALARPSRLVVKVGMLAFKTRGDGRAWSFSS